jgi:hypothetical protein
MHPGGVREEQVADPVGERLLAELEAGFEVALDRAENDAANDLALSLIQDRDLAAVLRRGPSEVLMEGTRGRVEVIGPDYVVATFGERRLIPLQRGCFILGSGEMPTRSALPLVDLLRKWTRHGARIQISHSQGTQCGFLLAAGRDHVLIQAAEGNVVISNSALRWIKLDHEGSADCLDD